MSNGEEVSHKTPQVTDPGNAMEVRNLTVSAATASGIAKVVEDVSFDLPKATITTLAGESGSGKTVTSLALMRLHDESSLRVTGGGALLGANDVLRASPEEIHRLRGASISMVFQDPMNSIDPMFTVGSSMVEVIRAHRPMSRQSALRLAADLFDRVGIPNPKERLATYPFELSGGLLQRVMIAMAIANDPDVLIADEPTTALDVTVQAQIMQLLRSLADDGMSILLVTHDLAVVSEYADYLNVMYGGQIIESGPVQDVLTQPSHPYTAGLIGAIPDVTHVQDRLLAIAGRVPLPHEFPEGCRFSSRCPYKRPECELPVELTQLTDEHAARCVRHAELDLEGVERFE